MHVPLDALAAEATGGTWRALPLHTPIITVCTGDHRSKIARDLLAKARTRSLVLQNTSRAGSTSLTLHRPGMWR